MSLSPEQIKALLNKPARVRNPGGRSRSGKAIDTSNRTVVTWFKLAHKLFDEETQETAKCSNPNCQDPRAGRATVIAEVSGQKMCRICFLEGWLLINPNQGSLGSGESSG